MFLLRFILSNDQIKAQLLYRKISRSQRVVIYSVYTVILAQRTGTYLKNKESFLEYYEMIISVGA